MKGEILWVLPLFDKSNTNTNYELGHASHTSFIIILIKKWKLWSRYFQDKYSTQTTYDKIPRIQIIIFISKTSFIASATTIIRLELQLTNLHQSVFGQFWKMFCSLKSDQFWRSFFGLLFDLILCHLDTVCSELQVTVPYQFVQ